MSNDAPPDFSTVKRILAEAVGGVFPSAQLLVVDNFAVALDQAVGSASRETLFDLASLTKALVTTTLAMRLVDERKLLLEDPLDEPRIAGQPLITIRQALSHSTGKPAWRPLFEAAAAWPPGSEQARRAVVEAARSEPLEAAPGARSAYSDLGFILLGDAIERAGGARLDAQWSTLRDRFRLGAATFHPDPVSCAPSEIVSGQALRGVVHDDNARAMGGVAGHAGLFGNARSVSTIVEALVCAWWKKEVHPENSLFVNHETVRLFWQPSGVPGSTWCLGWDRPLPVSAGVSSAGSLWPRGGVGHLGFTGCSVWIDPPRARWVILLSNRVHPTRANEAIKRFRPALHEAIWAALGAPA